MNIYIYILLFFIIFINIIIYKIYKIIIFYYCNSYFNQYNYFKF